MRQFSWVVLLHFLVILLVAESLGVIEFGVEVMLVVCASPMVFSGDVNSESTPKIELSIFKLEIIFYY